MPHPGVLLIEALPEFRREAIESLRQPLEEGWITIGRAAGSETFPAAIMFVAAMNPCPCGFWGDPQRACQCSPRQIQSYLGKISGLGQAFNNFGWIVAVAILLPFANGKITLLGSPGRTQVFLPAFILFTVHSIYYSDFYWPVIDNI